MLVDKRDDIKVQGNLDGQKVAMKFDENSLAHIMSVLTDLYSDPELAVIREYSTNALDSHKQAGVVRPIEVTLPSPLSPFFKIKDFGVGLDKDEIVNVYSKYGASTKRESNDFNGMLGLGGKSALTYTSQFNVIAVKDGIKIHISVSRAEDGTGTMEIVDEVLTDAGNGVEIVVPVKYGSQFEQKAKHFFSFWQKGTVLVNGEDPAFVGGTEVSDGIFTVHGLGKDYIVMGSVAYPVKDSLYSVQYGYKDFGVVAYVEIGEVNFTPSREALHYTPKTIATTERIRKEFAAGLAASIQADIEGAPTHFEAASRYNRWKTTMGYNLPKNLTYKGAPVPNDFAGDFLFFTPSSYRYQTEHRRMVSWSQASEATVITGFTLDNLSTNNRKKVKALAAELDVASKHYLLTDKPFGDKWLDGVKTLDWADVKAYKLDNGPRAAYNGPRGKQSYKRWDKAANWWVDDNTLSKTAEIYYMSPADKFDHEDAARVLTTACPGAMIVMLGRNRWDKFLREFPQAVEAEVKAKALIPTGLNKLTDDDKIIMSLDYSDREQLKRFDKKRIDDPEVVKFIEFAGAGRTTPGITHYNLMNNMANVFKVQYLAKHFDTMTIESPLDRYPLASGRYNTPCDHTYFYMNAAFAAGI